MKIVCQSKSRLASFLLAGPSAGERYKRWEIYIFKFLYLVDLYGKAPESS